MAKFRNIHSKSGKISFNDSRIEFSGVLETEDKTLIKFLSSNSNWVSVEEKKDNLDPSKEALKELKAEAKELGLTFAKNISFEKLKEQIEEFKSSRDSDADADADEEL